jgi:bifunctional NMN adenylyltransferase/nudix hydrolase
MSKSYSVFILRGQPVHKAHIKIIKQGLDISDEIIVMLGSYRAPITVKNPWDFNTRQEFIKSSLVDFAPRIRVNSIRDYLYSDTTWVTSLQNIVAGMVPTNAKVTLVGHFKDDSSYYLNFFPQWALKEMPAVYSDDELIDGTEIRKRLYEGKDTWQHMVTEPVLKHLVYFKNTDTFARLVSEYNYIQEYKKSWAVAPFPPVFVTTDAVVVQSGHILLIKRKVAPGKGFFALPGGFLNQGETIADCTVRELKEETRISIPTVVLEKCVKDTKCFDHPKRSLRGRSITHASLFVLDPGKPLPVVRGDDDADRAFWMPINDLALHEENFFEDHMSIINYFINKL